MFKRMAVGLGALLALSLGAVAPAAHAQGMSQKVGVCDPKTINNCLKPNSNGSINVSGTITASLGAFNPVGNATRSVSTTSANVALPTADPTVLVQNTGTSDAYIVMGIGSGTTATTSGTLIRAGSTYALNAGTATYLAAITSSGTTSLAITTGTGLPALAGAGGGGSGGAVTVASGADVTEGAITDTTCGGSHTVSGCLYALNAAMSTATPAGTNTIGNINAYQNSSGMVIPPAADTSAAINVSTATTTQIVALASAKKIYVSSFDVVAGGTGNITFVYGTGSNCGTGTTSLTGAYNLTAQAGIAKGNGLGAVLVVPASNALCVTTSAAVQMSGSVSYAQY